MRFLKLVCLLAVTMTPLLAQKPELPKPEADRPSGGVIDFRMPILADPVMQHSKETYILNGCVYCHGVDLKVRNGEAADLLRSDLVGADVDGNIIGKILRNGIAQTAKTSPMPNFGDLSDGQISDVVRWIHYSRQQEKFKLLIAAKDAGNAAAGKTYFQANCAACHTQADMTTVAKKYAATDLKQHVLKPALLEELPSYKEGNATASKRAEAKQKHGHLLENFTPAEAANLMAYLQTLK